jgi:flagellar motor component MotA
MRDNEFENEYFVNKYNEIVKRALDFSDKSRRYGLLSLEDELDDGKIEERDIFEYGLQFVIDGTIKERIEKILSNIIKQEKDEHKIVLMNIQKEAVLLIQEGVNSEILFAVLNSYTNILLKEDEGKKALDYDIGDDLDE